jgi:N-methylhydantoinase B/oxoprolinase/acetone carboxylase alpha subunit
MAQIQRVLDCIIHALAPVIPDRVTAGNSAHVMSVSYSGYNPQKGQYWVCVEVNEGSYGARRGRDGPDSVDNLMANTRNVPCEEIEMHYPLRVERYELRPEAPGAGRWRGGIGAVREVRFLTDGFFSCNGDRTLEAPKGLFGGEDGRAAEVHCNPRSERAVKWPSKSSGRKIAEGDLIQVVGPNAGGYGNPRERDPQSVLRDYLEGHITVEAARVTYAVGIDPVRRDIDHEETARLRIGSGR